MRCVHRQVALFNCCRCCRPASQKKKLILRCVTYSRNDGFVTIYSRKIYSSIFVELKYHFGFFRLCKECRTEHWKFFSQLKECASKLCGV
jgi:hypothetical protein